MDADGFGILSSEQSLVVAQSPETTLMALTEPPSISLVKLVTWACFLPSGARWDLASSIYEAAGDESRNHVN